jgi:hypothetical protein
MSGACSTYWGGMSTGFCFGGRDLKETESLEYLGVDERIILKLMLKKPS